MASLEAAAVVISSGNSETLSETLKALASQSHPIEQVVVVETSGDQPCMDLVNSFGFSVIAAAGAKQGAAIEDGIRALRQLPGWLWILHHDTAPEPQALTLLARAAEISPSVAAIGPKQLDWDQPIRIRQLGLTVTGSSRPFTLVEDEYDQGQFDAVGDALAVSTAGMLVATAVWQQAGGLDDSSPTFAQDIEFCIKVRALGHRVVVEPHARVRSQGALSTNLHPGNRLIGGRAEAIAKAHVHLAAILWPTALLPLLFLAMPLVALISIPVNLLQKRPARVLGQFSAWLYSWATLPRHISARKKVRQLGSITALRKLYASKEQIAARRQRRFEQEPVSQERSPSIFSSNSIWLALLPVLFGFGLFPQGAVQGGNVVPLGRTLDAIWSSVASSSQNYLSGVSLPSDPLNWFFALLAVIWPGSASGALAWFVFLVPAIAFIGFWFLASVVTDRVWIRNVVALCYSSFAPALLLQREAAIVELVSFAVVPWIGFFLQRATYSFNLARSWRWLGLAGLFGALLAVSAPIVFAAMVLVSLVLGFLRIRRLPVLVWFFVPGAALLAPWLMFAFEKGAWEILTATSTAASAPFSLYENPVWLVALGVATLLALVSVRTKPSQTIGIWLLAAGLLFASSYQPIVGSGGTLLALAAALFLLLAIGLNATQSKRTSLVLGTALSLAAIGSGVVFGVLSPRQFEFVAERQVPALVLAASDIDPGTRTLVIDSLGGSIQADLVWGDGRNLEERSLLYKYYRPTTEIDQKIAQLAGSLLAGNPEGLERLVAELGVDFVLVTGAIETLGQSRIAIDSLPSMQPAGQTNFGLLWSVVEPNSGPEFEPVAFSYRSIQLGLLAGFALLALPTPGSITGRRLRTVQR